ncbi:MAG: dUTP diphosphatase [Desulfobulbaceae bacterium]|nr:MAG: dUTP diphosphatase [Desulfobulbaceae bacterium]
MNEINIQFKWINPNKCEGLSVPSYETAGSAGLDICAAVDGDVELQPGKRVLISTNFAVAIPPGYEIQVRPRSGLAIKHGITLINSPGTIDSDYRGEVKVGLINLGEQAFVIRRGDRIAQMIVSAVTRADFEVVTALDETARGAGGFGHTGLQ